MRFWIFLIIIVFSGCTDISLSNEVEFDNLAVEVAIPLFQSHLTIPAISETSDVSGNFEVLPDGTVQVNYSGDVIRQTSLQIFPPVPGVLDIEILDTSFLIPLPVEGGDHIDRAVIGSTNIDFYFETQLEDVITVDISLPQLTKDGNVFKGTFNLDNSQGSNPSIKTGEFSIEGYELVPDGNSLLFRYDARTSNDERIKLDEVLMGFDIFTFEYVEGRFGFRTFDVRGDIITIDIFNNWVSGGISFLDPKVTLEVENAFGLKTKSKFNQMEIITVDGKTLQLESTLLQEGIDFDFPGFEQIGESVTTLVEFNSGNSNIKELFEQKASKVTYDIDALINSEDPDFVGFLTDASFFDIQVQVNLPIEGKVSDLVLEETVDVDLSSYEEINEIELKFDAKNTYPMDIKLQIYFQEEVNNRLDSIFVEELLSIEGAPLNAQGIVVEGTAVQAIANVNNEKVKRLLAAKKLKVKGWFDTNKYQKVVKLLDTYSLDLNVGAKIKFE